MRVVLFLFSVADRLFYSFLCLLLLRSLSYFVIMPTVTRARRHLQAQASPSTSRHRQPTRLARFRQAARQRQSYPPRGAQMLAEESRRELLSLNRGEFRALTESQQPHNDLQVSSSQSLVTTSTASGPPTTAASPTTSATPTTSAPPTTSGPVMSSQPQPHPWLPPLDPQSGVFTECYFNVAHYTCTGNSCSVVVVVLGGGHA